MEFKGNSWTPLGYVGFSAGNTGSPGLKYDANGNAFAGYLDASNNGKATVMKFGTETGIINAEKAAESSLTIFPNPNSGKFTVNLADNKSLEACLIITNSAGETVKELTIPTNQKTEIKLETPPGIYLLTCVTGKVSKSEKIILR